MDDKLSKFKDERQLIIEELKKAYETIANLKKENEELKAKLKNK